MSDFYSIIDYTVDGPEAQERLVELFAEIQERWVRFYPGYVSARFLASEDGVRVYNIVQWASEDDFRRFEDVSDTEGRIAAVATAVGTMEGRAEPRMTNSPRYRLVREVAPGPERS